MMIKTMTEFKLTVFNFCTQTRCRTVRVELPLDKKIVENQDWATGLRGRCRPQATKPRGCWGVEGHRPAFSQTHLFGPILGLQ